MKKKYFASKYKFSPLLHVQGSLASEVTYRNTLWFSGFKSACLKKSGDLSEVDIVLIPGTCFII